MQLARSPPAPSRCTHHVRATRPASPHSLPSELSYHAKALLVNFNEAGAASEPAARAEALVREVQITFKRLDAGASPLLLADDWLVVWGLEREGSPKPRVPTPKLGDSVRSRWKQRGRSLSVALQM
jgi:hypothetical protein